MSPRSRSMAKHRTTAPHGRRHCMIAPGEVVLGMAIASIVASHVLLVKKLERMIAEKNPPKEAAPGSPAHAN